MGYVMIAYIDPPACPIVLNGSGIRGWLIEWISLWSGPKILKNILRASPKVLKYSVPGTYSDMQLKFRWPLRKYPAVQVTNESVPDLWTILLSYSVEPGLILSRAHRLSELGSSN